MKENLENANILKAEGFHINQNVWVWEARFDSKTVYITMDEYIYLKKEALQQRINSLKNK